MSTTPLTTAERARIYDALTTEQQDFVYQAGVDWATSREGKRAKNLFTAEVFREMTHAITDAMLREFDALNKTPDLSRKMPEDHERYWFIDADGIPRKAYSSRGDSFHKACAEVGNRYPCDKYTEAQIQAIARHEAATRRWAELARDSAGMFERDRDGRAWLLDHEGVKDYVDWTSVPIGATDFVSMKAIEASRAQFNADGFTVDMLRRPA